MIFDNDGVTYIQKSTDPLSNQLAVPTVKFGRGSVMM